MNLLGRIRNLYPSFVMACVVITIFGAGYQGAVVVEAKAQQPGSVQPPNPFELQFDMASRFLPQGYRRPESEWLAKESRFFENILLKGKFDLLIIPCEVQQWAFDRATRSLMTSRLATMVAASGKIRVPDPYLVARALGDGIRRHNYRDYYAVANSLGVKQIVWCYVGHDGAGKVALRLLTQVRESNNSAWTALGMTKVFEKVDFDDVRSPIEAYESMFTDIMKFINVGAIGAERKIFSELAMSALPDSPLKLLDSKGTPARNAYVFLLLAALTPDFVSRDKERFVEKAYLASTQMSISSPEYRALRARIYMMMGYRPAALHVLGEPQSPEEKALQAVLNGNLPQLRAFMAKEKNQIKHLLLKLDEANLAVHYDVIDSNRLIGDMKALNLPGSIWQYFVARALTKDDDWVQHDNTHLKLLLDHELPVKGFSLEDIVRSGQAVGDVAKLQSVVALSVFNHGRKFLESDAAKWCCQFSISTPGVLDYLDLLQAMGHDNLIRHVRFLSETQGVPERAMQFANTIDAVYKGHPYYTLERSKVESSLAQKASGVERQGLLKSAYENAFNAMYWEQGQSYISNLASQQISSLSYRGYQYYDNLYYRDIPYRPYYPTWAAGGNAQVIRSNIESALKNATREIRIVTNLIGSYRLQKDEASIKKLLLSVKHRFSGSPQRNELLASEEIRVGNTKAAEAYYRENIANSPQYWKSYSDLGKMLFESGEVQEASKLFISYPGFKKGAGDNRVLIANLAYEVGSYFYWSGHFDLAEPFYNISAAQKAGANSDMTSALRLKLLSGDISGALEGSYGRARRYNSSYAYRDYLGMLHAGAKSKEAWAGFNALIQELPQPHLWETALVGHHIEGASEADIVAWVQQDSVKRTAERTNTAARYLIRFATTDRIPSKELAAAVDGVDHPVWQLDEQSQRVVVPVEDGSTGAILGPDLGGRQSFLPLGVFASSKKHRVKSHYSYFAEAYRATKLGDYALALKVFNEAARLYDMTAYTEYMLPYYALAASRAGNISEIEAILQRVVPEKQRFDYQLAKAVLATGAGELDEAMAALALARYRRPYTESRPFLTQYTFGEISEILATISGDVKIRALAIDWAKQSQKSEPWQSWSYAIEAVLTANVDDRKRALAMLYYLDPKSERLARFGKSEVEAAVRSYSKSNIFLKNPVIPSRENAA